MYCVVLDKCVHDLKQIYYCKFIIGFQSQSEDWFIILQRQRRYHKTAKSDTIKPPLGDKRRFGEFIYENWQCPVRDSHVPHRFVAGFSRHAINVELHDLLLTSSGRRVEKLSLLIPDVGPLLERRRHLSYGDSPASSPTAPYVQALCVSYNAYENN